LLGLALHLQVVLVLCVLLRRHLLHLNSGMRINYFCRV
jgi:hypothetical protein